MSNLKQIQSFSQIQSERRRLKQIALQKEQTIGQRVQVFQNGLQSRWNRFRWIGNIAGFVASNVGRRTLFSTVATKIVKKVWSLYKHRK